MLLVIEPSSAASLVTGLTESRLGNTFWSEYYQCAIKAHLYVNIK